MTPLTPEQLRARDRWQSQWNLPIILAALVPLFVNSPDTRWVQLAVGLGSWIVFVIDLVVQLRIAPDYLRERRGKFDLGIILLTFPYYLIPGVSGGSAILLLARLARVVPLTHRPCMPSWRRSATSYTRLSSASATSPTAHARTPGRTAQTATATEGALGRNGRISAWSGPTTP